MDQTQNKQPIEETKELQPKMSKDKEPSMLEVKVKSGTMVAPDMSSTEMKAKLATLEAAPQFKKGPHTDLSKLQPSSPSDDLVSPQKQDEIYSTDATPSKEQPKDSKGKLMFVTKRNGSKELIDPEMITQRVKSLCYNLNMDYINLEVITKKVVQGMNNGITTQELDYLSAEVCAYQAIVHPDYSKLAARIVVSNLHKETDDQYIKVVEDLYNFKDCHGESAPLISLGLYEMAKQHIDKIQAALNYELDYEFDFFGFKTLERSYLLKTDSKVKERPQHMLMRVSLGIHLDDIDAALETYFMMSNKWFIHATPTLFNSGTPKPQMSSCFLIQVKDDSIEGIYDTLKNCAVISKSAGGIGINIHNIRACNSYIRGTNGHSNGLVPMIRVFNDTARYVDQGGGKRKGAFAIYLEPWHADIMDFLELKKNTGKEEYRARDLFYGLWINDLFMKRVKDDGDWTLMCPNMCPGLSDVWGEEFETLYTKYEKEGRGKKIKARTLWSNIVESQIETGTPYILYKDAANGKSNQQNLGTIKSSNLCTEIIEYTSPDEIAVCNLASISLPKYIDLATKTFNYSELHRVAKILTINLNKIIDGNYYPVPEAKKSNMRHRPIGIGVQGFADVLQMMKINYEEDAALELTEKIHETIYHAAMEQSMELAQTLGSYETFKGSPLSEGKFQFDLWGVKPKGDRYDWEALRAKVVEHGTRNSLLVAPMPTASTSQILGNNESFEPFTSNAYVRRVLAGEFICLNPHLVNDLIDLNLWNTDIKNQIMYNNGSVQKIKEIPDNIKDLYKTVWEIKQKALINLAAQRAPYICQSQSMNVYLPEPTYNKITSMHFYGWEKGLKTGSYYLRTRPAADPIKFTVDMQKLLEATEEGNSSKIVKVLAKQEKRHKSKSRSKKVRGAEDIRAKQVKPQSPQSDQVKNESPQKPKVVCEDEICYSCGS